MSKSLRRVIEDARVRGLALEPMHLPDGTLTAQAAARAAGCAVDQIVKSVVLRGTSGSVHVLFLTAGNHQVDLVKAADVAGMALEKADAASIRAHTGFAIGGVSPFGHLTPIRTFMDPHLLDFPVVWAAAGTPHHVFAIAPQVLRHATGALVAAFT